MTTLARNKLFPDATPAIDIRPALTNLRTTNVDSFVVDKTTGEVLASYTNHDLVPTPYDYEQPQIGKTRAIQPSYELDPAPPTINIEGEAEHLPNGVVDLDAQRSKRGPKDAPINLSCSRGKLQFSRHLQRHWTKSDRKIMYGELFRPVLRVKREPHPYP